MLDEWIGTHGRICVCVRRDSRMALLQRPSYARPRERVTEFDLKLPDDPPATTWLAWAIGSLSILISPQVEDLAVQRHLLSSQEKSTILDGVEKLAARDTLSLGFGRTSIRCGSGSGIATLSDEHR